MAAARSLASRLRSSRCAGTRDAAADTAAAGASPEGAAGADSCVSISTISGLIISRWKRWRNRWIAGASSLRWFFLIVVYGVFIPSSCRHCVTVVAAMVITALAITAMKSARREMPVVATQVVADVAVGA